MKNKILVGMSVALFSAVAATVVLSYLNAGLRRDLRQKNDMLRGATIEKFRRSWPVGTYAEDLMFVRSCNEILSVVSNGQCAALNDYALTLLRLPHLPETGSCRDAENALRKSFYDAFLWRGDRLLEFDSVQALDVYFRVNLDLMIHYANLDIREGRFEVLPAKECLALKTLTDYTKKFKAEGKVEFQQTTAAYLSTLTEHIESSDGFTRRCAHYTVGLNTDLANVIRPGTGISGESGLKLGRAIAQGLVNCGYTPKWLDKEFPLPTEDATAKDAK